MTNSLLGAVNSNSFAKLKDFVLLSNILLYTEKMEGESREISSLVPPKRAAARRIAVWHVPLSAQKGVTDSKL